MAHESGGDKSRRSTLDKCWRVSRFSRKKEKNIKHTASICIPLNVQRLEKQSRLFLF